MKRMWILLGLMALGVAALVVWATRGADGWTTDSPEALAAFERGLQEHMKYYHADAAREFERAIELDPQFVVAKIRYLDSGGSKGAERARLIEELRSADRQRLTERERFILDVALANFDDDYERREAVLTSYLEAHPRDPWALMYVATDAWFRQDWEPAERLYNRLLEVDPNWVMARNNLGYMAMAQGRFKEAEEQFRTYRYSAPDQANPHDSLGELLVLIGRYDEARAELEEALAVRPDFCGSYENLFRLSVLERNVEALRPLAKRIEENCDARMSARYSCMVEAARVFLGEPEPVAWDDPSCGEVLRAPDPLTHALALATGRPEIADAMEEKMRRMVEKFGEPSSRNAKNANASLAMIEGQRLLRQGRTEEAIAKLREVEADSTWWGSVGGGVIKLIARLSLARALEATGRTDEAAAVLARLREVNPDFADRFADFEPGPGG